MSAPADTGGAAPAETISDDNWNDNSWGDGAAKGDDFDVDAWVASEDDDDQDDDDVAEPEGQKAKPGPRVKREAEDDEPERPERKAAKEGKAESPAKAKPTPKDDGAAKEAKTEAPRTYRVKLEKEERELDAGRMARALGVTEATLEKLEPAAATRLYQKLWHAEQQQSAGSTARSEFEQWKRTIKGNPTRAIEALLRHPDIALDMKNVAREYLREQYTLAAMTPEQREAHGARAELARMKAENAAREQAERTRRETEERERWIENLSNEIGGALTEAKLPGTSRIRARIVHLMQRERAELDARGDNSSPVSKPGELIPALRKEIQDDIVAFTDGMDGAALVEFLGEAITRKVRQWAVNQYKRRNPQVQPQRADQTREQLESPRPVRRRPTFRELLESM